MRLRKMLPATAAILSFSRCPEMLIRGFVCALHFLWGDRRCLRLTLFPPITLIARLLSTIEQAVDRVIVRCAKG
jgi:hypothetical protein